MNKIIRSQIFKMLGQMERIEPMWEELDSVEQRRVIFGMLLLMLGALIDD